MLVFSDLFHAWILIETQRVEWRPYSRVLDSHRIVRQGLTFAALFASLSMSGGRSYLHLQASWWRMLGKVGAWIHDFPPPKPAIPQFTRLVTTTSASGSGPGEIELKFYVRPDYVQRMEGKRFPVVVNFHGGGFTLGTATDDGRWASALLEEVEAVFVSVEYRLAPAHAFPTAVEDCLEALLYLANNADGFGIDATRMILTGFSAGGNLTFTVPLKLQSYLQSLFTEDIGPEAPKLTPNNIPGIIAIVSWYPILDYGTRREDKRAASVRPDKCLPPYLTDLFDEAYLPNAEDKASPYVSPAAASDELLVKGLPNRIALYLCEWDMLLNEGKIFAERLKTLGKSVEYTVIEEVPHAFDKLPALRIDPKVRLHYLEACGIIKDVLNDDNGTVVANGTSHEAS